MSDWLDKAKDAAKQAAEEARKLADKAKNADYGAMLEKTKTMAKEAAGEARKAAESLTGKKTTEGTATAEDPVPPASIANPSTPMANVTSNPDYVACMRQLEKVEALLQEIKKLLRP